MPKRKPDYEVVSGGLGSGKSSYALSTVDSKETLVLGAGTRWFEPLNTRFGSIRLHEETAKGLGFEYRTTRPWTMAEDIKKIAHPVVLIDEWTTFRHYSIFWSTKRVIDTIREIFDAINNNRSIKKVVFVCSDEVPYLPFSLYKKTVLWNKLLFKAADKITVMYFGIPSVLRTSERYPNLIHM